MVGRRAFLVGAAAAALVAACSRDDEPDETSAPGTATGEDDAAPETVADLPPVPTSLPAEVFALGVASGDPLPDSVIIWTRLVNDPLVEGGGLPEAPLPVRWEVAADERFDDIVASGDTVAEPAWAHSVHVDASGLEPDTWYWYRFSVGSWTSPVGRTRTAPTGAPDRLRFAFASCQNYQQGEWPALRQLADDDVDLVVFLGDYIYEDEPDPAGVRTYRTPAPVDLAGYRRRYGEYKSDAALRAAHAHAPWVCTWDDHEVENNYTGSQPGESDADGFGRRRAAAYQAYYEHMPLRIEPPDGADVTLYRTVRWGDLARFHVLDGRQYRSDQACDRERDVGASCPEVGDAGRTVLGEEQEAWLGDALADSGARWDLLAQQTVMSSITVPLGDREGLNLDQWDGYPAARTRLVDQLAEADNPVVLTGDIHASGVGVVRVDPDDRTSAVAAPELVGTSVSSIFPEGLLGVVEAAAAASPDIRYAEARRRGYVLCDVTAERLSASFRYAATTLVPEAEVTTGARWVIDAGDPVPRAR